MFVHSSTTQTKLLCIHFRLIVMFMTSYYYYFFTFEMNWNRFSVCVTNKIKDIKIIVAIEVKIIF